MRYVPFCEYCGESDCDRVLFRDDLEYSCNLMERNEVWPNNKKRKLMYASYIRDKYGPLGEGDRRRVPACVVKYISDMFPPPAGESQMGHHRA